MSDRSKFRGLKPFDVNQLLCGDCATSAGGKSVLWRYKDGFILGYVSECMCVCLCVFVMKCEKERRKTLDWTETVIGRVTRRRK